jgi:1,4-alpha-glucan branching enzyme
MQPEQLAAPITTARRGWEVDIKSRLAVNGHEHQIQAVLKGECSDPFSLLGLHQDGPDGQSTLRLFLPDAHSVNTIDAVSGAIICAMDRVHSGGFWVAVIPAGRVVSRYRFRAEMPAGTWEFEDTYRFPPLLGELDVHLLNEGLHFENYERLGAHVMVMDGIKGIAFTVWAPNASRVSLVGEFCDWDGRRLPMRRRFECGVWELFVPDVALGALYKYEIKGPHGELLPLKADPYALFAECPPHTASIINDLGEISWSDVRWMQQRSSTSSRSAPMSVYEVHLGSWRRVAEEGDRYLSYQELADVLVPYVQEMGFTHVELMPISEHPFDGSWGYQPVGLYAPTSRHGRPKDFAALIDRFHQAGIGVLLDWVPGHFPTDPHGLGGFDGTHLYEHADPRQGLHQDWNTLIYNYGRREVKNFLLGNALFWLDRYHLDGLRVDAVASMLYLNYSRKPGQWVPNSYGGNENLEAVAFIRQLNRLTFQRHPGTTTIAEESTSWPGVSKPVEFGGLGFGFKWNMGWMHDTLEYMAQDPVHRRWHHDKLTFGLHYAFTENFVLPLSHDEVVHGKRSLIGKMSGDHWQKFANLRAYYGFMFGHPGKKLLFMGGEFAQEREWSHDRSLDWHLLADSNHQGIHNLVADLNHLYRSIPAMHECDCESKGFEWVIANDSEQSVVAFLRHGNNSNEIALVVCNFTPVPRCNYRIGVPKAGIWKERLNTDAARYGGSNLGNGGVADAIARPSHGFAHSLSLVLPPLATVIFTAPSNVH